MILTIDIDTLACQSSAAAVVVAGKTTPITAIFVSGGVQQELDSDVSGCAALTCNGNLVAGGGSTSWEKTGSGGDTTYLFQLDCNTTEVLALLTGGTVLANGVLTIDWGTQESSAIPTQIVKANYLGTEVTPSSLPDLKATDENSVDLTDTTHWTTPHGVGLLIASLTGINFVKRLAGVTALVGGTAADLDAQTTVGLPAGFWVSFCDPVLGTQNYYFCIGAVPSGGVPKYVTPLDNATSGGYWLQG